MKDLFEKIEIGTSAFYCQMCGELDYGTYYLVLDDVAGIPADIETVCEYCTKEFGN